jgi:threonine dehydrogenase-like Zn-dependent dehydrogenase
MNAGRVIAVDHRDDRLDMARRQGAEIVNFDKEDPIEAILSLTGGIGVDRAIDAVGVDAEHAHAGPAAQKAEEQKSLFEEELKQVAPEQHPKGDLWRPGDGPSQALQWAVGAVAKAGTVAIIGVYPPSMNFFPIGEAMNKNLRLNMGNCHHRRYALQLVELVRTGAIDPTAVLTKAEPLQSVIEAYEAFDRRKPGWVKVELQPAA